MYNPAKQKNINKSIIFFLIQIDECKLIIVYFI